MNEVFLKKYQRIVRYRIGERESKARDERWQEERRLREEAELRRKEMTAKRETERRKRESLIEEARAWQTAKLLHEYIAHVGRLPAGTAGSRAGEWRDWARRVAEELDPLGISTEKSL